ncbi:N-6 DNA methylase [Oculatella sp. LEGE 06141]|uniref:Eco57I restriction-modification methylase domain-containing protein n=1 Tax=Oculatella sp. LEGE 06141 TaxID=1828648 RepID=UPI0018815E56|nr:N-6 DNA methylase [Oculatella sp. LEGE 06141]MBE9177633.1 N-6 DNA methylase [Oculatella sp. LEGE 06141]
MKADLPRQIERWQRTIANDLAANYPHLSTDQQHHSAQQVIHSILGLHLCEQRGVLPGGEMRSLHHATDACDQLQQLWQTVSQRLGLVSTVAHLQAVAIDSKTVRAITRQISDRWFAQGDLVPADLLGQVYEQTLSTRNPKQGSTRKTGGAYYTPAAIVHHMVRLTVGRFFSSQPTQPLRVLDPACGGGAFLLATYQYLLDGYLQHYITTDPEDHARAGRLTNHRDQWRLTIAERERILLHCIYGIDIDPQAIQITRMALLLKLFEEVSQSAYACPNLSQNIQCGNALISSDCRTHQIDPAAVTAFDWDIAFPAIIQTGGFEVVIGNPPYIDSERMSRYLPDWRTYCAARYRTAVGNWDAFCVFIEKALTLCRTNGFHSFVVPNKLAAADYAAIARSLLIQEHRLLSIHDYSRTCTFSVAVYPLVYVVHRAKPQPTSHVLYEVMQAQADSFCVAEQRHLQFGSHVNGATPWLMTAGSNQSKLFLKLRQAFPPLADLAEITGAATVAEAYELKALIQDKSVIAPGDLRLANSGTIDRYCFHWGTKPLRYLGMTYIRPVVPVEQTQCLPRKRYHQARQPKIVVAGMTKTLECALDRQGDILAAKSTSVICFKPNVSLDLRYLVGILNSQLVNLFFTSSFGGNSLNGGYLSVGPPQLRQIPMPQIDLDNPDERRMYETVIVWVDRLLLLHFQLQHQSNAGYITSQIQAANQAIDRLVCQLYRLTAPDTEMVLTAS